jgi:hypothetical protein
MWRVYGGAIMVIAGIAAFIEAHSHHPISAVTVGAGEYLSPSERAELARSLHESGFVPHATESVAHPASGLSPTAYVTCCGSARGRSGKINAQRRPPAATTQPPWVFRAQDGVSPGVRACVPRRGGRSPSELAARWRWGAGFRCCGRSRESRRARPRTRAGPRRI